VTWLSSRLGPIASAARVETAKAQLASAGELDQLTADQVRNEVSPEIDSIRAQVERQSTEQRLTNAANQLEKDKLTLARIVGLAIDLQERRGSKSYQALRIYQTRGGIPE
jgi:outer membrane protein TolC